MPFCEPNSTHYKLLYWHLSCTIQVKSRLQIYKQNAEAVISAYREILNKIDGNRPKDVIFKEIDSLLSQIQKKKVEAAKLGKPAIESEIHIKKESSSKETWRGIPTRLNNIPHSREIREYFYDDALQATKRAINDGKTRLKNKPSSSSFCDQVLAGFSPAEGLVKSRLQIYKQNAEAVISAYREILNKIDGNRPKDVIFKEIDSLLSQIQKKKVEAAKLGKPAIESEIHIKKESSSKETWRGIPTRLNNIPHSREIREYFYDDALQATKRAINDGKTRLKVEISIPELNPEMDVYRIGTLLELVRVLTLSFSDDGKRVKVCVQGSMGEGALSGMPLQLAGSRKILELMDWGDYGAMGTFINIGSIGAKEVDELDDMFILVAPQNAVGNCIIDDLKAMTDAAGTRPVILVNPQLKDLPSSSGIMQTMGRDKRLEYAASFEICYFFRLLYYSGTQYPIMAALRMSYPYHYELYKRLDVSPGKEKYVILSTFAERPNGDEINNVFEGKTRDQVKKASGIWGFLSSIMS
ncbi:unnamed protein product [Ilex paraguariensis]|uniref:DUF1995 domain-containing protein n=1 Tax=Ilex paraguariensis TaxID=185542 RepID=A0ABC8U7Q8_9AQUA